MLRYVMLCYVMLCYVMLWYVVLCYVVLCYVMLRYAMLCYVMLCYVMLCYVMLCYVMLCYVMLSYIMRCYAMLCSAMLCYPPLLGLAKFSFFKDEDNEPPYFPPGFYCLFCRWNLNGGQWGKNMSDLPVSFSTCPLDGYAAATLKFTTSTRNNTSGTDVFSLEHWWSKVYFVLCFVMLCYVMLCYVV